MFDGRMNTGVGCTGILQSGLRQYRQLLVTAYLLRHRATTCLTTGNFRPRGETSELQGAQLPKQIPDSRWSALTGAEVWHGMDFDVLS